MLHLCGLVLEQFRELAQASDYSDRLLRIYIDQLKTHMKSSHNSKVVVIVGCFQGLSAFLSTRDLRASPDQTPGQRGCEGTTIYDYLLRAFSTGSVKNQTRFEAPCRALEVFAKHAHLYRSMLPRDHSKLYANLFELCDNHNKDIKSAAFRALEAFLQQAAILIMSSSVSDTSRSIFTSLMRRFLTTMRDPAAGARSLSVAIRGCGYLAAPCMKLQVRNKGRGREKGNALDLSRCRRSRLRAGGEGRRE